MGQVTISGVVYDVHGTTASLKSYMSAKLGSPNYDAASSNDRLKAHVSATRWIDRETWQGTITDAATPQALEWPRTGVIDRYGDAVASATTPTDIEEGVYEAVEILLGDVAATSNASQGTNVKSVTADTVDVKFFRPGAGDGSGGSGGIFPTEVQKLVGQYLTQAASLSGPTVTGTNQASTFCADDYGLSGGLS